MKDRSTSPVSVIRFSECSHLRRLALLEREAAHLTRRDGKRRLIVERGSEGPAIEEIDYDDVTGPRVLSAIDMADAA